MQLRDKQERRWNSRLSFSDYQLIYSASDGKQQLPTAVINDRHADYFLMVGTTVGVYG